MMRNHRGIVLVYSVALILSLICFWLAKPKKTNAEEWIITSYCSCYHCTSKHPNDKAYGITASGKHVKYGMCAVDRRIIPLDSKIYIEGLGIFSAEDTGGAIRGHRIDVYCSTHEQAKKFGVKRLNVEVLK